MLLINGFQKEQTAFKKHPLRLLPCHIIYYSQYLQERQQIPLGMMNITMMRLLLMS